MTVDVDIVLSDINSTTVDVEVVRPEIVVEAVGPLGVEVEISGAQGPPGPEGPQGPPGSAGLTLADTEVLYVNVGGDSMTGPLILPSLKASNTDIAPYSSGGTFSDALKFSSSNLGAAVGVQNRNPAGYSGIEYMDQNNSVAVFTGYNNGNPGEFRFNNIAGASANIRFKTNGGDRLVITDAAVTVPGALTVNSTLNAVIVRVPGIDLWNDGTIYFSGQTVSLSGSAGAIRTPNDLRVAGTIYGKVTLPADPVNPLEASTKQYSDGVVTTHDGLTTAHANLRGTLTPVVSNTGAGVVGTSTKFSREDHKHQIFVGTPVALGSANADGVSSNLARSDHVHIFPTAANVGAEPAGAIATHAATAGHELMASTAPTSLTPDIAGAVGVGTTVARADHVHNVPAAAPTTPLSATTTDAEGTGSSFARNDHTHSIATAAPVALGGANAAGSAATLARSDHVHIYPTAANVGAEPAGAIATHAATPGHEVLASTAPAALGAAAAVGVGTTTARADHVHIFPTAVNVGAEPAGSIATHDGLTTAHAALQGTAVPVIAGTAVGVVGTSTKFAREDHKHQVNSAAPVALGSANAVGTATTLARSDHVHIFPTAANVGADPTGTAAAAVLAHEQKTDPHGQYLTDAEGDAKYSALGHTHPIVDQFRWDYDSSATMADPGAGRVRTDTAAGVPSTQMAFSQITGLGIDISSTFSSLTTGDLISFQQMDNADNWGRYYLDAPPVDQGTWWLMTVTGGEQHGTVAKNKTVLADFVYGTGGGSGAVTSQEVYADAAVPAPSTNPIVWVDLDDTSVEASPVWRSWTGTQAAYNAISVKDPGTLYAVVG